MEAGKSQYITQNNLAIQNRIAKQLIGGKLTQLFSILSPETPAKIVVQAIFDNKTDLSSLKNKNEAIDCTTKLLDDAIALYQALDEKQEQATADSKRVAINNIFPYTENNESKISVNDCILKRLKEIKHKLGQLKVPEKNIINKKTEKPAQENIQNSGERPVSDQKKVKKEVNLPPFINTMHPKARQTGTILSSVSNSGGADDQELERLAEEFLIGVNKALSKLSKEHDQLGMDPKNKKIFMYAKFIEIFPKVKNEMILNRGYQEEDVKKIIKKASEITNDQNTAKLLKDILTGETQVEVQPDHTLIVKGIVNDVLETVNQQKLEQIEDHRLNNLLSIMEQTEVWVRPYSGTFGPSKMTLLKAVKEFGKLDGDKPPTKIAMGINLFTSNNSALNFDEKQKLLLGIATTIHEIFNQEKQYTTQYRTDNTSGFENLLRFDERMPRNIEASRDEGYQVCNLILNSDSGSSVNITVPNELAYLLDTCLTSKQDQIVLDVMQSFRDVFNREV